MTCGPWPETSSENTEVTTYIDILFKRRFSESACKAVAVIGSTEEGRRRVQDIEGEPLSGSKNGDEVFFYEL